MMHLRNRRYFSDTSSTLATPLCQPKWKTVCTDAGDQVDCPACLAAMATQVEDSVPTDG